MIGRKKCTAETTGIITDVKRGKISVRYHAGNHTYEIKESLKVVNKTIKVGAFPIGQRKQLRLGNCTVGGELRVLYDPNKPGKAYLPDNFGYESFSNIE